jgi:hypothetical protein
MPPLMTITEKPLGTEHVPWTPFQRTLALYPRAEN